MNTFLSDQDQALKQQYEQFAKQELAPSATTARCSTDLTKPLYKMAELDYLSPNPFLHSTLLVESIARFDPGMAIMLAYHIAATEILQKYGTAEQQQRFLPSLAKGKLIGTIGYSQANEQEALIVTGGSITNLIFVFLQDSSTEDSSTKCVLIDQSNAAGIAPAKIELKERQNVHGLHSIQFADLNFSQILLKEANYLGDAEYISKEAVTLARNIVKTLFAATALGIAESTLQETTDYAKLGKHNGQDLSQSEAIQWKLADAAADTSAASFLVYRAAWSKDEDAQNFSRYAAMCKAYASRVARIHTAEGMQIISPLLNETNSLLPNFYLDSKLLETFEHTNEEEKLLLSDLLINSGD